MINLLSIQQFKILFSISVLVIFLSFTPLSFISLFLIITLWVFVWPYPNRINTLLFRFVISFCLSTAFIQIFGIILWVANIHFTTSLAVFSQLILLCIIIGLRKGVINQRVSVINKEELGPIIITLLTVLVIALGTLHRPLSQGLLQANTSGFDDAAHTSLSITTYQGQGYVYGPVNKTINILVDKNLSGYPQGWHMANSVWWHSFSQIINPIGSPRNIMFFYVSTKIVWFGILIYSFGRILLYYVKLSRGNLFASDYFSSVALVLFSELVLFFGIYKFGAVSFIPILIYLIITAIFIGEIIRKTMYFWPGVFGALLLSGAMGYCWLLAAPIGLLSTAIAIFYALRFSPKLLFIDLSKNTWKYLFAFLLAILGCGQFVIQLLYNNNTNMLNTAGGIWPINMTLFGMSLLIIFYFIIKNKIKYIELYLLLLPSLVLMGLVYIYQLISSGHSSYYSTKIGFMAFILVLLTLGVTVLLSFTNKVSGYVTVTFLFCMVVASPMILGLNMREIAYVSGNLRLLSSYSASQILNILDSPDANKSIIIINKDLNYEEDVITTNYLRMLRREQSECSTDITWSQIINDDMGLYRKINDCSKSNPSNIYYIITSSKNYQKLLEKYSENKNIKILLSN